MIEGVDADDLKNGPGHYPDTPLPGEKGNAAIAGHRSTYGAPFANVDNLDPGDPITVTTLQGSFHYSVTGQEIVSPDDVQVLDDKGDNELTLTACHPKYSASKRIVIHAKLEGTPVAGAAEGGAARQAADAPKQLNANVSGESAPKLPADPVRAAVRGHLGDRMVGRQALAQVAVVSDQPAVLPDRALLLLRKLLPAPARRITDVLRGVRTGVIVLALMLAACSGSHDQSATTTQPLDPFATTGPVDIPSRRVPAPARRSMSDSASTPTISRRAPRSICRQCVSSTAPDPHQHEVYAIVDQSADPGAPYPGDDVLAAFADDRCLAAFTPYTGIDYRTSHYDIANARPDKAAWDRGERRVICALHDVDFAELNGLGEGPSGLITRRESRA